MNKLSKYLFLSLSLSFTACNNDIFIDPLKIDTECSFIDWTGGVTNIYVKNQPVSKAILSIVRITDEGNTVLDGIPIDYALSPQDGNASFSNDLFEIDMHMDDAGSHLTIDVSHNYYPDTVFIRAKFYSEYDNGDTYIRVLPSPGFTPGEIEYTLYSWYEDKMRYCTMTYTLSNHSDKVYSHTLFPENHIIAASHGWFSPWNDELSKNIFGRDPSFKLPTVSYDNRLFQHSADGQPLPYTSDKQQIDSKSIIADRHIVFDIPPKTKCHFSVWVDECQYGFDYTLPAINPASGDTVPVEGIYWLCIPESYNIETQFSPI